MDYYRCRSALRHHRYRQHRVELRELNHDLNIVAAATDRENVKKLRRAGADVVLSPAVIGGHLLVQSALGQGGMEEVADRILTVSEADDVATDGE